MNDKKAVILLSGGLDSATVVAMARAEGYACYSMSFDYGQRHRAELQAAERVARQLGVVEHKVIGLNLNGIGGSALTDSSIAVPESPTEGIPATYVPARNTVFLALALGWAEVLEARDIFIGVNAVDYSGYPDCRDDTIKALQVALGLGLDRRLVLHTPLMWRDKAQTFALAKALGGQPLLDLVLAESHSCYLGDRSRRHPWGFGCGACPACDLRARGYAAYLAAPDDDGPSHDA